MREQNTRRRFLTLTGLGAGALLAGCLGDSSGEETEPPDTTATTETTATTTTDEPETTTAEPTTMSTVFHFSKPDEASQKHAAANVANLLATEMVDTEEVVLVANGSGIEMLTAESSAVADKVSSLLEEGASFRACENSMAKLDVEESDLIEGVETVPAGVGELTRLQAAEGFAYIEVP